MQSIGENRSYAQLIEFDIEPHQQDGLVAALASQTERLARDHQGFLSASVQASDDGRRVLNYLQWQSKEAGESAFAAIEAGHTDFWGLIRTYEAKAVTFGSFQVLRSLERSVDDALQCRLVSRARQGH